MLDRVADESGVAVVVLDDDSNEVSMSNNNSICRALWASPDFRPRCNEFCGSAFRNTATGEDFEYECHAGLVCKAVPVADRGKRFVAIIGRSFTTADNYRKATDRAISGDWRQFPPNEFFENVLMSGSMSSIEDAAADLEKYRPAKVEAVVDVKSKPRPSAPPIKEKKPEVPIKPIEPIRVELTRPKVVDVSALRSLFGRLSRLEYFEACAEVLEFLSSSFSLASLVWLERKDKRLVPVTSFGLLRETPIRIGIPTDNRRLVAASQQERPLELRERVTDASDRPGRLLNIFTLTVGGEIRGALGVEGPLDEATSTSIARFCRRVGPQLEILRLQHEVSNRDWLNRALTRFNESLKRIDADDFWTNVTQLSAELVQSERASILIRDEHSESLTAKAAIGARINLMTAPNIGEGVAKVVLDEGDPVVVEDIKRIGIKPAPPERRYKTRSFISYPILIGDRRIGVMNFTDKADGDVFNERDLELLRAIAPQIAVAIDRTVLKNKAGELEQLSVTDSLTGLLNRRYLDKRMVEEIQRSKRHRFPMSLMMLDIDEFKSYNDAFGHQAGDRALKTVAGVLQDILRGADVAARYGGEEFAILLPQTTSNEAAMIAERLRQRIEHTEFPNRRITISIGIASISNDIETPSDIIGAADHALYEAKNNGRNKVQIYDGFGKFNEKIN